jgi:biotin carboxylase
MFENTINLTLKNYKLKPIQEYQDEQESHEDKPCIAFFSTESEKITLLLAASKIVPECAFVVPEPTWVKVVQSGENSVLYLLEGIGMNEFGQCFHFKFKNPKKITFICNFYTEAIFSVYAPSLLDNARKFRLYEELAECPMSSSVELAEYTNDKLHTRLLAAERNVNVPQTMAFCFSLDRYSHHPMNSKFQLIPLSKDITTEKIKEYLTEFTVDKFVIKPSDLMGSRLCTIESKDNLDVAVENFKKCLYSLHDNDCLLVEEFIDSSITDNFNLGARVRVFVTRRPNDVVETSGIICNLGYIDKPISGATSEAISIDYLCNLFQLTNNQKNQLLEKIYQIGKNVLEAIIIYETEYLTHITQNKQTDFIGLDIFFKNYNGILEAFLIEVNDQDSIGVVQTYEIQRASSQTNILDKWVETMLYRSYEYMLKGKTILIIGGGDYSNLYVFEFANKLGINITLIDNNNQHFAVRYGTQFFNVDIDDQTKDFENALAIVELVCKHRISVDCVVTFCEANVPLSNLVARFLGKSANAYHSVIIAQSKLLIYKKIISDDYSKTFLEPHVSYSLEVLTLKDVADLHEIPQNKYPVVINLDTSYSAFGGELVHAEEELLARFEEYKSRIQNSTSLNASLGLNHKIIVMPYLQGSEHDVDLIMSNGELLAGYVTDKEPTMPNYGREMTATMPSLLDKEKQENLIRAAWKTCHDIGLNNGVFKVTAIYTALGVKIIQIKRQTAGSYTDKWLFDVWDVNLVLYTYLIACGIKPFVNKNSLPRQYYNSFLCYASLHKDVIDEVKLKKLSQDQDFSVVLLEKEIPSVEIYEKPYASVATCGENIQEAQRKMKKFLENNINL